MYEELHLQVLDLLKKVFIRERPSLHSELLRMRHRECVLIAAPLKGSQASIPRLDILDMLHGVYSPRLIPIVVIIIYIFDWKMSGKHPLRHMRGYTSGW